MNVSNVLKKEDGVHGAIPVELLGETALALINATDELVVLAGENGNIIALNNKFAARYETDGVSIVGSSVYNVLTGDLAAKTRDMVPNVFRDGKTAKFEARTSGSWMEVKLYPIRDSQESMGKVAIFMRDITRERKYEEALRESEKKYRQIVNTASEGICVADEEFRITFVNAQAQKMFGCSEEEMLGKSLDQFIAEEDLEDHFEKRQRRQEGLSDQYERRFRRKDGQSLWVNVSASPILNRKNRFVGSISLFTDITARKQMEDELLNFRKLESVGILAGGIAHDFNNLLMSMLGYISLAKMYLPEAESKARDKLTEAERTIDRAKELTAQLLTFSRGGSPLKKTLHLQPIVREVSRISLSGSRIKCRYNFQENIWPVDADETQIRQVIHQLVRNAREAMPEHGGSLSISVRNRTFQAEPGMILPTGDYVELSISDTGKGITKEHLSQIFDPYFTTKDFGSQKGMGLGLAVCYSIIKKHGGQIEVESQAGEGATFNVYLPARRVEGPKEETGQVRSESRNGTRLKVLIADDEQSILQTTTMLLTHLGYDVTGVADGRQAIDLYRTSKEAGLHFDVVILDLISPNGLDGVEILRQLLAIDPGVSAILSSGYPNDPQIINHRDYGFKAVLVKPYRIEDLNLALKLAKG
ncbi:MAG: Blue-light-activated protein [Syntrophorhabdus sp. PtaB.Bin184]|nr:MAG: Blue-light-activated protein [Syntrophorhabdus sp. PtaB.Bin184]